MRFALGFAAGVAACVALTAATVWRVWSLHEQPPFGTVDVPEDGVWW